jgi:hypothetical protein
MSPKSNYHSGDSLLDNKNLVSTAVTPPKRLVKTQNSFEEDLKNFADGTVPQSLIVATVIGKFLLIFLSFLKKLLHDHNDAS